MTNEELTAIERVKMARHSERPYSMDLFNGLFDDFVELHGDRRYADDAALVCGFARLDSYDVAVIGHQKGRDTKQRRVRNFGMPKPEGYRKALRIMKLAEKFSRPIMTFVDTPGAYPGIDAEERGQAEAIAYNLREMSNLKVPIISVILGEGGSGGALAIAIADYILMLENAVYSVISPEGCAAILFKDAGKADRAAASLKLTAEDLHKNKLVDGIVQEPSEWKIGSEDKPSENHKEISGHLKTELINVLKELEGLTPNELIERRISKFREMGTWQEG